MSFNQKELFGKKYNIVQKKDISYSYSSFVIQKFVKQPAKPEYRAQFLNGDIMGIIELCNKNSERRMLDLQRLKVKAKLAKF